MRIGITGLRTPGRGDRESWAPTASAVVPFGIGASYRLMVGTSRSSVLVWHGAVIANDVSPWEPGSGGLNAAIHSRLIRCRQ